jgi:Bacterial SH3 domain
MNKFFVTTILASSLLLLTGRIAGAQTGRARIADTPIREEASLASAIIATVTEGGAVDVVDLQGDWFRVVVPNEQGKPRTGYVLARLIEFVNSDGSPMLMPTGGAARPVVQGPRIPPTIGQITALHEREQTLAALALERDNAMQREQTLRAEVDALKTDPNGSQIDRPTRQIPLDKTRRPGAPYPQAREGFWFNAGLGFGSYSCETCISRVSGGSGDLSLGGTINDRVLLGGGSTGYFRSFADGSALGVGTLDARVRVYPIRTSGFFLMGGIGLGTISFAETGFITYTENGVGVVLGLGWDIRVRRNLSLTPFWNGVGVSTANRNAGFGQLGLGITVH